MPDLPIIILGLVLLVAAAVLWRLGRTGPAAGLGAVGLLLGLFGLRRARPGRKPRDVVASGAPGRKARGEAEADEAAATKRRADAVVGGPLPKKPSAARDEAAARWNRKGQDRPPAPTNPPPRSGTRRKP